MGRAQTIKHRSGVRRSQRRLRIESLEGRRLLATYYINSSEGSDANAGTSPDQAWASIAKVNSAALQGGDEVLLQRGSEWNGELRATRSGTASNPIRFGAYGTGARPEVFQLYVSGDHTVFEELTVDHQKKSGDAVRVRGAAGVVLRDMEIRNGLNDGVDLDDADGIVMDGLYIHHFLAGTFTNQADAHGVVATGTRGLTIRNTEIHHVSGDSFQADPGRNASDITTDILIEDSHFWTAPLEADFGAWRAGQRPGENAVDTKVVKNGWENVERMRLTFRNVTAHGWLADGYIGNKAAFNMKEKIDAVFDGVTVYDSEIAFRLRGALGNADVTIQNAVIYDVDKAFRAEDNLKNLELTNSTFGDGIKTLVQFAGGDSGKSTWNVRNNAFVGSKPGVATDPSNRIAVAGDFVNPAARDYRLATGSSLVDAGTKISSIVRDRSGVARPQGATHDVGAYERTATTPPSPAPVAAIDLRNHPVGSYGGKQDKGTASVQDQGDTLHVKGNAWKQIAFPYQVTPDTILEFDFRSSDQAEVHAIGFDNDLAMSEGYGFQLYGTQKWGSGEFRNYADSVSQWKHYRIPVGEFYTGAFSHLFFGNDHDVSHPSSEGYFANIKVYESGTVVLPPVNSPPVAADDAFTVTAQSSGNLLDVLANDAIQPDSAATLSIVSVGRGSAGGTIAFAGGQSLQYTPAAGFVGQEIFTYTVSDGSSGSVATATVTVTVEAGQAAAIDLRNHPVGSYGGKQDKGTASVQDQGATLHVKGNAWKQIAFPYQVTPDTILEFDFRSSDQAEVHAIGFDNDLAMSEGYGFQLYGTQKWGSGEFRNYADSVSQWKHYRIPVGEFYTGAFSHLFFGNDHDVSRPTSEGFFANIKVYEQPTAAIARLAGSDILIANASTAPGLLVSTGDEVDRLDDRLNPDDSGVFDWDIADRAAVTRLSLRNPTDGSDGSNVTAKQWADGVDEALATDLFSDL